MSNEEEKGSVKGISTTYYHDVLMPHFQSTLDVLPSINAIKRNMTHMIFYWKKNFRVWIFNLITSIINYYLYLSIIRNYFIYQILQINM